MRPLTLHTPKPLLKIKGRPILDYIFEALPQKIDEVIVVVDYLRNQIKNYLGEEFRGHRIKYVIGSEQGTASSFLTAKNIIEEKERFLLLYGDELVNQEDLSACCNENLSAIVFHSKNPHTGGVAIIDDHGFIKEITEKPEFPVSDIVVGGIMVLNERIFDYEPIPGSGNEFYLSTILNQYIKEFKVKAVFSENFLGDITSPEDLERIGLLLKDNLR